MDRRLFLSGLASWAAAPPLGRRLSVFELALRPKDLERYRMALRRVHADSRWLESAAKGPLSTSNRLVVQRGMLYFYERLLNRALPGGDPIRVPYWPWENRYAIPARRLPLLYEGQKGGVELTAEDVDVEPPLALRGTDDFFAAAPGGAAATVAARMRLTPAHPAYWAHLANVDRLWASWTALGDGRKPPEFRNARAGILDDSGLVRSVALQELRDARSLGYEYSTLMKPLRLGTPELLPLRITGAGYVEGINGWRGQEVDFLLLRRIRTREAGRLGLFAGRWRLLGTFSATGGEWNTAVVPAKSFRETLPEQPQLIVAKLDDRDQPIGTGLPLEAREAYLF